MTTVAGFKNGAQRSWFFFSNKKYFVFITFYKKGNDDIRKNKNITINIVEFFQCLEKI